MAKLKSRLCYVKSESVGAKWRREGMTNFERLKIILEKKERSEESMFVSQSVLSLVLIFALSGRV